jgi:branched-chain amino acid transport system permease protein
MVFLWLGAAEAEAFNIDLSFQLLFIIIIGGLGSIVGAFFGAAIIHLMPIALRALPALVGLSIGAATIDQLTFMITGLLIIVFLIVEPLGLARLWQTTKQKLRAWPFPY